MNRKNNKKAIVIAIIILITIILIASIVISKNIKANKIRENFSFTCNNFIYDVDPEVIYYDLNIANSQNYEILEVYINDTKIPLDRLQVANFGYRIQLIEKKYNSKNKVQITILDKNNNVKITKEIETTLMHTV